MHVDLTILPEEVRESAYAMANGEKEELHGWKAITHETKGYPVRYMIITDKGYYEVTPDGIFVRAAVLRRFK